MITRRFIDDNRELFLLQEPASELQLASAVPDDRGGTVLRFTQTWQGFEVWPGQITANVAADGRLTTITGAYSPSLHGHNPALPWDSLLPPGAAHRPGCGSRFSDRVTDRSERKVAMGAQLSPR